MLRAIKESTPSRTGICFPATTAHAIELVADSKQQRWIDLVISALRCVGWAALVFSLLLHVLIVVCFTDNRDAFSVVTMFPIWFWAMTGAIVAILASAFLKSRIPVIVVGLWIITGAIGSDERRSLTRGISASLTESRNQSKVQNEQVILRVATINCTNRKIQVIREAIAFDPDIIFVQESPPPNELRSLIKENFGLSTSVIGGWHCSIIAKGKLTKRPYPTAFYNHGAGAMLTLPNGAEIELLSLHLESAVTRWDLWNHSCWIKHRNRSRVRREQLTQLLANFEGYAKGRPRIFGGDFNSSPTSNLYETISSQYTNAFDSKGKGIGNTFTNHFPVIRIDHIYADRVFKVMDARSVRTRGSDHRMVVCDLILN